MADTPPPETPAAPARKGFRSSPLAKRLPLLLAVGLGLWLWQVTGIPERELVIHPSGDGWRQARAVDLQVSGADGELIKREERFFGDTGAPPELTFKVDLPEGDFRAVFFVKLAGREERQRVEERLSVGEERYIVRQVELPAATR
ncbi:hypothetical protein OWM54_42110 [Myxococcus sp. MISCRS1]|uniref:hypothetical protein n=1 Tax=Myxococcus sp. MISCRS1 TaxID=2996786 RepID=UPI00226EA9D2|nr:hypothetical protein [Myxococcus sp. MISCRS1]MCY1003760.1 hypothetical protein [Myxococcus sp. MISCRS1]